MSSALNGSKKAGNLAGRLLETPSGASIHAVLLYGAEGAPLDVHADKLARAWLCVNLQKGQPCEECRSCLSSAKGAHVDLKRIDPAGPSSLIRLGAISASKAEE